MKIERKEFEPIEAGVYGATVQSIEVVQGTYGEQLQFVFDLGDDTTFRGWCSPKVSSKSKLLKWATALLGDCPEVLDTDTLIGKSCRLMITQEKREDGSMGNRLTDLLAAAKPKAKPQPIQAVDEAEGVVELAMGEKRF